MPMAVVSPGDVIRSTDHNSIVNALSGDAGETLTTFYKGADLASTAALTIPDTGNYFDVTGTTNITSLSALPIGTVVKLHFDGALTLVHDATNLILSGGVSYTTAAGDEFEFISYGSGTWRETHRSLSAITTTVASTFGATPSLAFSTTNAAGSGTGFLRRNATIALYDTTVARALAFGDVGTVGSGGGFAAHVLHGHPMPGFATPNLTLSTTWAEGNATTPIRSNAQLAFFDTTAPTTVTFGDVGSTGSAAVAARRDHGHPFASGAAIVASVGNALNVASTNGNLRWSVLSATPSGAAGGELAGTYPNPTVASTHSGSTHVVKEIAFVNRTADGNQTVATTGYTDLNTSLVSTMTTDLNDKLTCFLNVTTYSDTANAETVIALALDNDAVASGHAHTSRDNAATMHRTVLIQAQFSGLSAASHTVKAKWKTSSGTATVLGNADDGQTLTVIRST